MAQNTLKSVENALDILELFSSENRSLSLKKIQEKTKLHKSTVYRLVTVLRRRGYLERDEQNGVYNLGLQLIKLASSHINDLELLTEARPLILRLHAEVNLTSQLCVLEGTEVVYLDEVNSFNTRKYTRMGFKGPAFCSSLGKVLLSNLSGEELDSLFFGYHFIPYTPNTLTSLKALKKQLRQVRQQGWALNQGELVPSLSSIAAPIFDYNATIIAAISLGASTAVLTPRKIQEILPSLKNTALAISKRLGFIP
ncbi:IclR family transcriptional regulator [Anaerotruncus rubiinfantis]|uniref:IclR family transcriptional regulator n=1 Tax=Anaerotruncus rubiinfantis TaxID=1720200 RepID=UPI0034A39185